jgi:hypothetical protein
MPAKKAKTKPKSKQPQKQNELIIVMIISLILGVGGGYLIGANTTQDNMTKTTSMTEMSSHSHSSTYEVSEAEAPKVELVVSEDAKSGYNVKIIATDFTFTPENVNEENVLGEGHAHLYVDGEKVGRLYGPYYHYDGSFEGSKTFKVTLNANDHSEYTVEGEVISSEVVVTHDSSDPDHDEMHSDSEDHSHSDM